MITDQVVTLLSNGQALTISELVNHISDLANRPYSDEVLRLLMRLDKRFRENNGRWVLREGFQDSSELVLKYAQRYFQTHPRGELIQHLITYISSQTNLPDSIIEQVVKKNYKQVGKMIINQRKEHN